MQTDRSISETVDSLQKDNSFGMKGIVSNNFMFLYSDLKEYIMKQGETLCTIYLVIPNKVIKSWLQVRLAQDLPQGVAFGIEYILPSEFFEKISPLLFHKRHYTPTFAELLVLTSSYLLKMHNQNHKEEQRDLFDSLVFRMDRAHDTAYGRDVTHNKLFSLAYRAARVLALQLWWGVSPQGNTKQTTCEQEIITALRSLYKDILSEITVLPLKSTVSLGVFGFSTLCPKILAFFENYALHAKVMHWCISPCMMFWNDICTDEEAQRLQLIALDKRISQGQQEYLEELLYDRNSLLANIGRIGRKFSIRLEEAGVNITERYVAKDIVNQLSSFFQSVRLDALEGFEQEKPSNNTSILQLLQTDILLLHGKRDVLVPLELADRSIQIHSAPTKLREVEILYSEIVQWIDKHNGETLAPGTIIVHVPKLSEYKEYIECVFAKKCSTITYQFLEREMPQGASSLFHCFLELLRLTESRWTSENLYTLFRNPSFCRKAHIRNEDHSTIRAWLHAAGFSWGLDEDHRQGILKKEGFNSSSESFTEGSWQSFEEKLVNSWALYHANKEQREISCSLDTSTSDCLSKCITQVRSLYHDLRSISEGEDRRVSEWADILGCLLKAYFAVDQDEKEEIRSINQILEAIALFRGKLRQVKEAVISFDIAKRIFSACIEDICKQVDSAIQSTIIFASLGHVRNIPARFVGLLGLNEGEYPRRDENLLLRYGYSLQDYNEYSLSDLEKYMFLETLLSANEKLHISYQGYSFDERSILPRASCVDDMLYALDVSCSLSGKKPSEVICFTHGFTDTSIVKSVNSTKDSDSEVKIKNEYFMREGLGNKGSLVNETLPIIHMDIHELLTAAKSPLQLYFQKQLKMPLYQYEELRLDTDEFSVSSLEYWKVKKSALSQTENELSRIIDSHTRSQGVVKKILVHRLAEERRSYIDSCNNLGIDPNAFFTIEFSNQCTKSHQVSEKRWVVPAPCFEIEMHGYKCWVFLEGEIEGLCEIGFIIDSTYAISKLIRSWPQLLLRAYLGTLENFAPLEKCYFLQGPKELPIIVNDPAKSLKKYITYTLLCKEELYPLYPDWIEPLIEGSFDTIQSMIDDILDPKKKFNKFPDPALSFFLTKTNSSWIAQKMSTWRSNAIDVYEELEHLIRPQSRGKS